MENGISWKKRTMLKYIHKGYKNCAVLIIIIIIITTTTIIK
jgi:hypothetical protein